MASEKQVVPPVPTPLFLSVWSFVLDKQILFILSLGLLKSCNLANFISCCFILSSEDNPNLEGTLSDWNLHFISRYRYCLSYRGIQEKGCEVHSR